MNFKKANQFFSESKILEEKIKNYLLDENINETDIISELKELKNFFIDQLKVNENDHITLLSNKFNLYDKVELKKSNVSGLGVFAKVDIPIGSPITFYPANCVINFDTFVKGTCMISYDEEIDEEFKNRVVNDDPEIEKMKIIVNEKYSIIANAKKIYSTSYLAHLVKDCVKYENDDTFYLFASLLGSNCRIYNVLNSHLVLVSMKDIKKGEELYCTYGVNYWKSFS